MKKTVKLIEIIAFIAVISFSFVACGGDNTTTPQTVTYSGTANGSTYTLTITEGARYVAQVGDSYVLTVTTDGTTKTSNGTVTAAGNTLTLMPTGATTPFTVSINSSGINAINGEIKFNDGTTEQGPGTVEPITSGDFIEVEKTFEFTNQQIYAYPGANEELNISGNVILSFVDYDFYEGNDERKSFGQVGKITNGKISLSLPVKIPTEILFKKGELYSGVAFFSIEGKPEEELLYCRKNDDDAFFCFVSQNTEVEYYGSFEKGWNFWEKGSTQEHFWQLRNGDSGGTEYPDD